jgi:alpha-glucosidase
MPDTWDETRGLGGYPGEYISVARRVDDQWFIGTVNNEDEREIDIPLTFLDEGEYEIILYSDTPGTHYKTNKEDYQITSKITAGIETIQVKLVPGGGHCMWIKPKQ